jgi:putative ABC transport system permease protein
MRDPFLTRTREQIAADNRAEIDGWIDERAAELAASGIDPAEARRRAVDEFGDVAEAQRYAVSQDVATDRRIRAALWVEEFGSDVRIAMRTLSRAPTVTAVVLLTFALGIGAATAVFSVVYAMFLRPLPYGDEETLVQLQPVEDGVLRPAARYSAAALVALRDRTTSFTGIAGIEGGNAVITGNGDPEQVMVSAFTPNGFDVVRARAAIGRTFRVNEESGPASRVVVLLDGLWRRRFGADPHIVGRTIDLDGGRPEVIGVMPRGFRVPAYEAAELLTPRDLSPLLRNAINSQVRFLRLFARLKPGVSRPAAQADVDQVMRALQKEDPRSIGGIDTRVVPIRAAVTGDAGRRLLVLMGAAAVVLLIACANVAGILLSRAIARRHELSVRVALGAGRRRLIRQFLAEGAVLATFGAGLGLLVSERGIAALQRIGETALPAGTVFALEPRVVLFAIVAAMSAAFVSSLVPALGATRTVGNSLRRDDGRASPSRANRRLRLGLVAAQLGVSVVLLIGAGLFLRTFQRLSVLDLGYATEQAVTFRLPFTRPRSNPEQDAFWASLYERLRATPGVASVGGGNMPMSGQSTISGLEIEGRLVDKSRLPDVRYTPASDDYFAALGIPIARGRAFDATDRDGAPAVAVISTGLAKQLWPGADPIGARVRVAPAKPWATIVGIVGDVRMGGADAPRPSIYTSQRQDHWPGGGTVVIRAEGDPGSLAAGIRQAVKNVDPTLPIVGLRTLEEFRRNTPAIAERRLQMHLMMVFAFAALAVSAIGVYGVSAYAIEARRREFGIRIALGASRRGVLWLALRDGAQAAVLGALAGVPIALVIASHLGEMLYAVTPFDPLTVGAVLGALIVVVCAASVVPARRATLIDPASTMRTD